MLIAYDLAVSLDAAKIGWRVGLRLDDWQSDVLRRQPKRALLLCSRQSGKSTVTALAALHTAIYQPGSLTIIISSSQRQSAELFRVVMGYREKLGAPLRQESVLRAEFENGSRILALPGSEKTTRGYAGVSLAIVDEASRVDDELTAVIRPMLGTTDGSLIALSTPCGRRGWFFEAWVGADQSWYRVRVPASDCPRLSPAFLESERTALDEVAYQEEYCLSFVDSTMQLFPSHIIERALSSEVQPLWA